MGSEAVPGSQAALARLREAGVECRYVTNTTKDTISNLLALVQALGFDIQRQEVGSALLCAPCLAAQFMVFPPLAQAAAFRAMGTPVHYQFAAGLLLAHRHSETD